jgi:hypothetical protein
MITYGAIWDNLWKYGIYGIYGTSELPVITPDELKSLF